MFWISYIYTISTGIKVMKKNINVETSQWFTFINREVTFHRICLLFSSESCLLWQGKWTWSHVSLSPLRPCDFYKSAIPRTLIEFLLQLNLWKLLLIQISSLQTVNMQTQVWVLISNPCTFLFRIFEFRTKLSDL